MLGSRRRQDLAPHRPRRPPLVVMQIDDHIYEMLDDEADIIAAALLAAARSARADQTRSHQ